MVFWLDSASTKIVCNPCEQILPELGSVCDVSLFGSMQPPLDSKNYCNFMDKLPIYGDSHHVPLPRPFGGDPFVTFHVYPETPPQVACSEDLKRSRISEAVLTRFNTLYNW
ncbi:hypothetical protein Y1Q_0000673 [Alligator mississippiensis]|uniref:Uncharacterized protein n=1 Tax=Alligator mississippiensis TaxID=8496 RepID=A0A151MC22_ALLMI|nr:hypothetical protein Y1Q_0000673 [Alligator mississippiensis]